MTSSATVPEAPRGEGAWADRIPLIMLLLFLWSIEVIGVVYIVSQYTRGRFDLAAGATLWNLCVFALFGVVAIGTTIYVRARFR